MQRESFENELVKIISISKDFGAEKVLLFGSCLKEIELARDIDIAVSGIEPKMLKRRKHILKASKLKLKDMKSLFDNKWFPSSN